MDQGELPLWEPLIRLYDHRDGGAPYHLKLDVSLSSGKLLEILVVLSETELTISSELDNEKAPFADRVVDTRGAGYQILESEGAYRLAKSIDHLADEWDLFSDFDGQLRALASAVEKINGYADTDNREFEYTTRQEVESMFNVTLTDSQWRAICSEMQEQPDQDYIDEFPTFLSVLEDVVKNIDLYEQDWILQDKVLGQTTAQALEAFEPNSTKRKD
jgi:hypothetical protein